jgi:hypothetical protein
MRAARVRASVGLRVAALMLLWFAQAATAAQLSAARALIGLLRLPALFGDDGCGPASQAALSLFDSATATKARGQIVASPRVLAREGGCEEARVRVQRDGAQSELPTLEADYEQPAAIVLERQGKRARIALAGGSAWVPLDDQHWLPAERLLVDKLLYLRPTGPGGANPSPRSRPAEWIGSQWRQGRLWVQVRLPPRDPCSDEPTGSAAQVVWLAFHRDDGEPALWFHSRGC